MNELEKTLLWMLYAAALEAKKLRKFQAIVQSRPWKRDVIAVAGDLVGLGLYA